MERIMKHVKLIMASLEYKMSSKTILVPETSKVPPPRSNTRMVSLFFFSNPYASEAAVGSLMILRTSNPAMRPASFVAVLWESLKYAGTVTTAFVTLSFRNFEASSTSFLST